MNGNQKKVKIYPGVLVQVNPNGIVLLKLAEVKGEYFVGLQWEKYTKKGHRVTTPILVTLETWSSIVTRSSQSLERILQVIERKKRQCINTCPDAKKRKLE